MNDKTTDPDGADAGEFGASCALSDGDIAWVEADWDWECDETDIFSLFLCYILNVKIFILSSLRDWLWYQQNRHAAEISFNYDICIQSVNHQKNHFESDWKKCKTAS